MEKVENGIKEDFFFRESHLIKAQEQSSPHLHG